MILRTTLYSPCLANLSNLSCKKLERGHKKKIRIDYILAITVRIMEKYLYVQYVDRNDYISIVFHKLFPHNILRELVNKSITITTKILLVYGRDKISE